MPKRRIHRFYYRNGQIHMANRELDGGLHGVLRTWHFNGQLAEERNYRCGLIHGVSRQWDESGRLLGSFEMNLGTGRQRYWYENGQPKLEMDFLDGKFHGRLRMWLRDGTLVKEAFHIRGPQVSRAAYLNVATKNPDWPQYKDEPPGKIARQTPSLKKKEYKLFVESVLERPHAEARQWLSAETKRQRRSLPIFRSAKAALRFVEQLYAAGANTVEVVPIYSGRAGKLFADWILIQLPKIKSRRAALRKICQHFCQKHDAAMLPDRDIGENHLFLRLH